MARAHKITAANANRIRWEQHNAEPGRWFWPRVFRSSPEDCWPWTGRVMATRGGYGRLTVKGKMIGAHRMALILHSGGDMPGLFACHRCDNPICCNPLHLFWGTPLDNTRDCLEKKRRPAPHPRKINLEEVVKLHGDGWSYSRLATLYAVNQASIGKALKRAAAIRAHAAIAKENEGG